MTSLATGILGQRSETELFFMEALNEVKCTANIVSAVCGFILMLMLKFIGQELELIITINGKRREEKRRGVTQSSECTEQSRAAHPPDRHDTGHTRNDLDSSMLFEIQVKDAIRLERKAEDGADDEKKLSSTSQRRRANKLSSSMLSLPALLKRETKRDAQEGQHKDRDKDMDTGESCLIPGGGARERERDRSSVCIKDLSWSDKELVLRVLFAKLNEPKPRRDTHHTKGKDRERDREKLNSEPAFFVSEGAMGFTPSDGLGGVDMHTHMSMSMDIDDDGDGDTHDDSRYGFSSGCRISKSHNRLSNTS